MPFLIQLGNSTLRQLGNVVGLLFLVDSQLVFGLQQTKSSNFNKDFHCLGKATYCPGQQKIHMMCKEKQLKRSSRQLKKFLPTFLLLSKEILSNLGQFSRHLEWHLDITKRYFKTQGTPKFRLLWITKWRGKVLILKGGKSTDTTVSLCPHQFSPFWL